MDPLERLVNLLALLLSANRPLTFEEIRTRMGTYQQEDRETSKRQFERDKDLLRGAGIPIEVAPTDAFAVEEGYWIPREEYELQDISFTPEEVAALFVTAHAPGGDGAAAQAFLKLAHGADTGLLGTLSDHGEVAGPDLVGGNLLPIAEAAAGNRRVAFGYQPASGRGGEREVDAWALVFRSGSWYLVGNDRRRKAARSFRLSRVTSQVRDLGLGEPPPEGFDARELLEAGPWGLGKPQKTAQVAFSPKVAWWATGTPGIQAVRQRRDKWVVAEVPTADPDAFASWVLSFGPDAKVLSPRSIREVVVSRLQALRAAG